ncbi:aminotransferase [Brenneria tiliae]|uniref:aminotransferase n=1 Tax=Brenneria tiliae TaxID=2914984 RepID=UPI002014A6C9|nr:aminotransferase [Brenneria tiliae]MCL2898408.1 aminotransferase [Brenneria tiliae]MCL2903050.1 aminotransferase [Brenneria tiliae]
MSKQQIKGEKQPGKSNFIHPFSKIKTLEKEHSLIIERGEGCYVFDNTGKRYLEGLSGLWCVSLGFSQPRLVRAAAEQLERLPFYQCFGKHSHQPGADLADKLASIAPTGLQHVLFANSGSEANDAAVKLAWYYNNALGRPEKKKIIARKQSYHGVTVASGSLTGQERVHQSFDLPIANILHTDFPSYYHERINGETEEEFSARIVSRLENMILKEGPETIAAFIAEPVMTGRGVILPPRGYFENIQALLKKYDILFIVDEVVCGFGRTGNMFGSETYHLAPDMISVAKGLSSGYQPISALLINGSLYDVLSQQSSKLGGFFHGTTYSAHPVAAAVALEVINIYQEENILANVKALAPYFGQRLKALESHPIVGETRSVGLLGGVELAADREKRASFDGALSVPAWVQEDATKRGLIIRASGQAIAICPPLIITREQIDELFDILRRSLDAAYKKFKSGAGADNYGNGETD